MSRVGWVCPGGGEYIQGVGMSWGGYVQGEYVLGGGYSTPDIKPGIPTPSVLTPSGGHQNTCGWQACGIHPTGMLSCYDLLLHSMNSFT